MSLVLCYTCRRAKACVPQLVICVSLYGVVLCDSLLVPVVIVVFCSPMSTSVIMHISIVITH